MAYANRKIEVLPGTQTWLEAIHRSNIAHRKIVPNRSYDRMFFAKDKSGEFKPVPEGLMAAARKVPIFTGTAAVIGERGEPLGSGLQAGCLYAGEMKTVIFVPKDEAQARLTNTLLMCDQGFVHGRTPSIMLYNARTLKQIRTEEDMLAADEVMVKFNGRVYTLEMETRISGTPGKTGEESSIIHASESAVLSLATRTFYDGFGRKHVYIDNGPECSFVVAVFGR